MNHNCILLASLALYFSALIVALVTGRTAVGMGGKGKGKGVRQQLGIKKKGKTTNPEGDHMARQYAKGKLRASDVGRAASASINSHPDSSCNMVQRFAKAAPAAPKKGTRNSARNLKRAIVAHATTSLTDPYMAECPMWDRDTDQQVKRQAAFLPPHEVLDRVIAEGEESKWCNLEGEGQVGLRAELQNWAARLCVDLLASVPWLCIALWGDSAPMGHRNSLYLLTFTLLSGEVRRRYWLFACTKRDLCDCGCSGKCTFETAWQVLAWSCKALLAGRWPETDHLGEAWGAGQKWRAKMAGKPLRFRGAVLANCGDWAWFKSALNLRGWRGEGPCKQMCWLCNAGFNEEHDCFDFRKEAPWRRNMVTMSEVIAETTQHRYPSGIWSIPGLTIGMFKPDWMHCCDLGILQYVMGSVMWELLRQLGGTMNKPKAACAKLLMMSKAMARELGVEPPFTTLTYGMIRSKMSKSQTMKLKAAEGRYFYRFFA